MPKLIFNPLSAKLDYVSTKADLDLSGTNSGDVTVTDTSTIDFTLTGQALTGSVIQSGITHNNLGGLTTGDPHTQYAFLLGRSGGQTLIGGTAANDDLTLEGTSSATRTTSYVILQPNGGNVGIGTTAPTSTLHVVGTGTGNNIYSNWTTTATSGDPIAIRGDITSSASSNSSANLYGLYSQASTGATSVDFTGVIYGYRGLSLHAGTGTVSILRGIRGSFSKTGTGNITSAYSFDTSGASSTTGTITSAGGILINTITNTGGGTITGAVGLTLANQTAGTNNTLLLMGTSTVPTGSFGIYNSNTNDNYFAGNVGIGTTSPTGKLEVSGGASVFRYDMNQTSPNIFTIQNLDNTASTLHGAGFTFYLAQTGQTTALPSAKIVSGKEIEWTTTGSTNDSFLGFETKINGTLAEKVRIDSSGKVGIGTTSPTSLLSLGSNAVISRGTSDGADNDVLKIAGGGLASDTRGAVIQLFGNEHATTPGNLYLQAGNSGGYKNVLLNSIGGNVGIGTTGPTARLDIDQSSTTGAIPVLQLDQADVSEEFISFLATIGTGNSIEAIGAKTLTTTHFIKVKIQGGLIRYFPVGTIS